MSEPRRRLTIYACILAVGCGGAFSLSILAEEPEQLAGLHETGLHKPVYRVTKQDAAERNAAAKTEEHPLDPAVKLAHRCLAHIRAKVDDYTCILIKRERVGDELSDPQYILAKVRNEKRINDEVTVPFSVYLKFLKPAAVQGREVIYVAGQNDGNLIAHEGGWKGKVTPSIQLNPLGTLAMMGQRYPITEIGIENLCMRLIEKGMRDKRLGMCQVEMRPAKIMDRPCTRIQVKHPKRLPHLDFHEARIFVDDQHHLPVRYEAYDWPRSGETVSQDDLIEEYTYLKVKVNVGLSDRDFDPANEKYNLQ